MLVKATARFLDAETSEWREAGETFEASEERVAEINGAGWGNLVEPVDKPKKTSKKEA